MLLCCFLQVGLIGLLEEAGAETMQPVGCALMELAESTLQSHLEVRLPASYCCRCLVMSCAAKSSQVRLLQ